jgi:hypothetical protein
VEWLEHVGQGCVVFAAGEEDCGGGAHALEVQFERRITSCNGLRCWYGYFNECEGAQRRESEVGTGWEEWWNEVWSSLSNRRWARVHSTLQLKAWRRSQACTLQDAIQLINLKDSPIAYTHRVAHDQARICKGFVACISALHVQIQRE